MILRDPVHGLISFAHPLVAELMDTREVQRLRRIRALGLASLAFPGGEHSRFAHAVGSAHVMQRYLERVRSLADELPAHDRLDGHWEAVALAAALLHDLGHGPYSHTFESVLPQARAHEQWTSQIILDPETEVHQVLRRFDPQAPAAVEQLIHGRCPIRHLARAVSGTFDVDRCDYLMRDSHMTGVRYGLLDLDWLLASLRLYLPAGGHAATLAVDGAKGLTAVEGFFLARLYMYRQVYLHKAVRAAEVAIRALFRRLHERIAAGEQVPGTPQAIVDVFSAAGQREVDSISTAGYLDLDDTSLEIALWHYARGSDPVLAALATSLRDRKLPKSIRLRDDVDERAVRSRVEPILRNAGFDPRYFLAVDRVSVHAYVEDEALVVLSGPRVQSLLEASLVMRGLASEVFVSNRVMFPASVRESIAAAVEDLR